MDIPIGATVSCIEGNCGESTVVILDPTSKKITHVVVKSNDFPHVDRLVPIDIIQDSTPDSILLDCTKEKLARMDEFSEHNFIRTERPYDGYRSNVTMLWPDVHPINIGYIDIKSEHIPPGELAIRRGEKVQATDGRVGVVDEFLIVPANGHATHIILQEGHLWGKKDVAIPISQVDHISESTVYLDLDKASIASLPTIPVKRWI